MHGDERVQTGSPASAHEYVLVVECLEIAIRRRVRL
jgi:hypothetical protein